MITILTTTYNRAYTLGRLYKSLVDQTNNDFEWIVIDDGSKDNTKQILESFIKEKKLSIVYRHQPNAGKPSAVNYGLSISRGEYVLIVDSDDLLISTAIIDIKHALIVAERLGKKFSGLGFRKAYLNGDIIGNKMADIEVGETIYLNATSGGALFQGDLAYCFRKNIMLENKFPVFPPEKFVPELYIWNKITDVSNVVFFPDKVIYLCEYLGDGLTHNFKSQLKSNPKGFGLYYSDQYRREKRIIKKVKMLLRRFQCYLYERMSDK